MTAIQTLLGNILRNRINAELKKETKDFISIQETMDIFLAGDKITAEQYSEFTGLITQTATDGTATTTVTAS